MFFSLEWHLLGLLASMIAVLYNVRRGTWEWASILMHLVIIWLGPVSLLVAVAFISAFLFDKFILLIKRLAKNKNICFC